MSKVLVIHPKDESTDFLKYVYKDYDYDVITDPNYDRRKLAQQIDLHDKIIMLGHGTDQGLLNPSYIWSWNDNYWASKGRPYIIDSSFADLLNQKETVSIWCNSDQFFRPLGISGFHTAMIISECAEQQYVLGRVYLNAKEQLYNMLDFARIVGQCIEGTPEYMRDYILEHYDYGDAVTNYNRKSILVL